MHVEVEDQPMLLEDYDCPSDCATFVKCVFCGKLLVDSSEEILGAQLLLCFHSACRTCVAPSSWANDVQKTCPSCKVSLAKDLLENKILQEIVAEPQPESLQNRICSGHPGVAATRWCKECSGLMCSICIEAHKNVKTIRDHQLIDAEEAPSLLTDRSLVRFACNDHPARVLEVYCEHCEKMTCRDCQLERHKQHNYQFIEERTKELKKDLIFKQAKIQMAEEMVKVSQKTAEETKGELRAHKVQLQKALDDHFTKVRETVDTRYRELKTQLDTLINDEIKTYEENIAHNNEILQPIRHSLDVLRLILHTSSDPAIIYSQKHLNKCLQLLLYQKERMMMNSEAKKTFKFYCSDQSLQQLVQMIEKMGDFAESSKNPANQAVNQDLITQHATALPTASAALPNPSPARISLKTVPTGSLQSPEATRERNSLDAPSNHRSIDGTAVPLPSWHSPEPRQPPSAAQCPQKKGSSQDLTLKNILRNDNANTTKQQARPTQVCDTTITPVLPLSQVAPTSQAPLATNADQSYRFITIAHSSTTQQVMVPMMQQNQLQSAIQQTNQLSLQHLPQQQPSTRSPTGVPPPPPYVPTYGVHQTSQMMNNRRIDQVNRWQAHTYHHQQQQQQLISQQLQLSQMTARQQQAQQQTPQQNPQDIILISNPQDITYFPGSTHNPYSHN